ncbi:hypothetical protein [Sorangium sp. So ce341]|uniref:hypothetical protein n=1 Tax=Sorangium sp. So ce341 TaxID=3133302 RepID=UPI003F60C8D2
MCATAANLIEDVLPAVAHRPWVLTFLFPWRRRLAQDGALFGVLTRIFVESVERFYEERAARRGACGAVKSGAVTVVRRTSGDMRLNPHLHVVVLDGLITKTAPSSCGTNSVTCERARSVRS